MTPNRVATALAVLGGIATAVSPVVADLDTTSTAGVIAGGISVTYAIASWLKGWQQHEDRQHWAEQQKQALEGMQQAAKDAE